MIVLFAVLAAALAAYGVDFDAINARAREQARAPIRSGVPGVRPFWNANARMFLHPPAFDFKEVPGRTEYLFRLTRADGSEGAEWKADKPWRPVPAVIWDSMSPGECTIEVEGSGRRTFWRSAPFKGPYAYANHDYAWAVSRAMNFVFAEKHIKDWLISDVPPEGYDLYCYPAKIVSAAIRALVRVDVRDDVENAKVVKIARKMADWLMSVSQPEGAPLAFFPPTYWGDRRVEAVRFAGLNMLGYPAAAGIAFLELAEKTGETRYRRQAVMIADTYLRLQEADGTWPLMVAEKDGRAVRNNRLIPSGTLLDFLDKVAAVTGEKRYSEASGRAFGFVLAGPCRDWNWDAQFEDQDPRPPYENLQKGTAVMTALRLFRLGKMKEGCELVDWCEDQFTVWSDPIHFGRWREWRLPVALEQYNYFRPIDASLSDMIEGFAAAYKATGDRLYYEKAKALADNLVNGQRRNGKIPTYFDDPENGSYWLNCHVRSAQVLEAFAEIRAAAGDAVRPERIEK